MSLQHGLSGLNAAARNLDVIGNNVANANTVGAKTSRAEFADVYANSLTGWSAATSGIGVTVTSVAQQFTQGDIATTQNPLDMAINGSGFFRLSNNGLIEYTRNGQFRMDKDGYITSSGGSRLTGYRADSTGRIDTGAPAELRLSSADISPKATDTARAQLNLDAREKALVTGTDGPFNQSDPKTYHGAMSTSVYDSLGRDHQMTMYFRKTAANTWDVHVSADGGAATRVTTPLVFNGAGALTSPTGGLDISVPVDSGAGNAGAGNSQLAFNLNLSDATQFGGNFSTTEISQNGYGSGRLSGFSVDEKGVMQGRYSNGQVRAQGQIVLASFINPQGLVSKGNNTWVDSSVSGQATLGTAGSGILGSLEGGAVENSNVDLTAELVNMITAQRVYQANAQTIKTQDQLMQTIVNLR